MAEYAYDAFDRRIQKWVDTNGNGTSSTDEVYSHLYDTRGNVLLELDGAGDVNRRYLHGPLVDQLLADENADTGEVLWPLGDHQNTVRDLVDSSGTVQQHIEYDAFGNITNGVTPLTDFLFTGQQFDAETGLYYYGARYYDPGSGRFISEDPIQLASGDANLYRYVGNNPVLLVDPTGLSAASPLVPPGPSSLGGAGFVSGLNNNLLGGSTPPSLGVTGLKFPCHSV